MPKKRWKELDDRLNEIAQINKEAAVAQQEFKAEVASFAKEIKAAQQKTEAAQQKTDSILTGIGVTIGLTAEDLFRRNVKSALERRGIIIDRVMPNISYPGGEFDLLCPNGTYTVLVEVKARLRVSDINFFVKKQIPDFRKYFTEYQDQKLIGALASEAVNQDLEKKVEKAGLFSPWRVQVFTQTEEGGASIANSSDFKPMFY